MLDPLTGSVGRAGSGRWRRRCGIATGVVLAAQVGALTGYLAQRVLGQYDLALLDATVAPRLLFVAPNLNEAAGRLEADREELLRWVAFHEVTHAVQFTSVPWLREHLGGMLRELLDSLEVKVDARGLMGLPGGGDLRGWSHDPPGRSRVAGHGAERRALIDRMQATMAVIEGHAEHVMDAVGIDVLPVPGRPPGVARATSGEPSAAPAHLRATARARAEDAPVPGRQALLRPRRRGRRNRRARARLERAGGASYPRRARRPRRVDEANSCSATHRLNPGILAL